MIESVLGPVPAETLGRVSTNEHVLTDSTILLRPTREGGRIEGPVRPEVLGDLRWSWLSSADNLALDSLDDAVSELADAVDAGISTIVEATSHGMGPRHAQLPEVARRSGMTVVAAYGSYIDKTLPAWWRDRSEADLEAEFHDALETAIPGTGFRAGLLGLLGTSAELTPAELRALRAAGRAAAANGAAVSIRLDAAARRGPEVADLLIATGLSPERILFCNIDKVRELDYVTAIADRGAVVEFAFGSENHFGDDARDANDDERIHFLLDLLEARPSTPITLSCSVWTKGQLTRHGGMGYGHVVRRIVPALARAGVSDERLQDMLVQRPALLLDRR
jgi:phosphotriesterase-related protein